MDKKDKTVHAYLKSIDSGPLLTKDQEESLIKNVEVYQKEILSQLIMTKYARHELRTFLQNLESSGKPIIDISKKLDEESPKQLQNEIQLKFKSLIKELGKSNVDTINSLLNDVSLTGTILHGIVTEIKKKHDRIISIEQKYLAVKKYFRLEDDDKTIHLLITEDSDQLKLMLKSMYGLNDIKASNKITEWKHVLSEKTDFLKYVSPFAVEDIKTSYKNIAEFEFKASKYKNELITKNLRLVISRAKKHLNKGLDFEDLIQEGNIGLMKAVDKFDSSKKTKVSTYATWWIDQSIKRSISNKGKTVRVPTHIEWMETNLKKLTNKMTQRLGRPPTLTEISVESGIDLKQLEELQTRAQHEIGLEEELSSGMSLMDILPSDPNQSPFQIVEQKLLRENIRDILSTLNPRTEKIIRLRFGIGEIPDDEGNTLQAIANEIGITKQGVRVVECSAFKQLRKRVKGLSNE